MPTHLENFQEAAHEAEAALCYRAKCGSIIVAEDGEVIGRGHNSPPNDDESQRTCNKEWDLSIKPKYDKTCCMHAEWNAVLDACKTSPDKIGGSTLYFMRIDEDGNFTDAGEPYCTTCSRLTLASGVGYFAVWDGGRPKIYTTPEYNQKSYDFYLRR